MREQDLRADPHRAQCSWQHHVTATHSRAAGETVGALHDQRASPGRLGNYAITYNTAISINSARR